MNYLPEPERDALIRKIRQNKDELDWKQWGIYSCKVDFTIDELREFQDYIDWHCYFVYCSQKRLTVPQLIEFKDKDKDWVMIFEYRFVGEQLLRRYVEVPNFSHTAWRYIFDKQKVSKQFRHRYKHLIKKK